MKHGNSIRAVALALTLCGLVGGTAAGDSIKCKAICPSGTECKTSDLAGPVRESWLIGNCENRERKVDRGCVNFWYFSKSTPQLARVCAVNEVAVALKDPDLSCSFLDCLWPKAPRAVPGANPIGSDDSSSTSSGAKAGLPFGTVLPSPGALSLMVSGPAAGESGTLTLTSDDPDAEGSFAVAITANVPQVTSAFAGGGIITETGGYRVHTFTGSGTLNVFTGGNVEVLVVAGGGSGGGVNGGGGGGGGVVYNTWVPISAGPISVTVGAGGVGGIGPGVSGGNSSFGALVALGGGGGGNVNAHGESGGSGGDVGEVAGEEDIAGGSRHGDAANDLR